MSQGFIKLFREKAIELLTSDPKAFLLLSCIALRARRTDANYSELKANQAFIGDNENAGLSKQEYRNAKKRLARYNLAVFKPTNKGTIATLSSAAVYDINAEETSSEQPSNSPKENRSNQPPKNPSKAIQEPTNIHQKTLNEPLTRKEECKKAIMKENPPPHLSHSFKEPKALEDWKRMMISLGWTEQEFNEAWKRYLLQPRGSIKNVRKWLETVMQSIRDSEVKEGHLQKAALNEALKKAEEDKFTRLESEKMEKQQLKKIQENKKFMRKVNEMCIGKEKYELAEQYVKLLGGKWGKFCLGFSDDDFIKTVREHLDIDEQNMRKCSDYQ